MPIEKNDLIHGYDTNIINNDINSYSSTIEGTQLVEQNPQLETPQRIAPPASMNTPIRKQCPSKDKLIREIYFSPRAYHKQKYLNNINSMTSTTPFKNNSTFSEYKLFSDSQTIYNKQLKDYTTLVVSSHRAGRYLAEANAYFSMGILYDNLEEYENAIESYLHFLKICDKLPNSIFYKNLGNNAIGYDYQILSSKGNYYTGSFIDSTNTFLKESIKYHQFHLDIADEHGSFIAHTNLGLAFGSLDKTSEAAQHHQEALRIAIKLKTTLGQSIAVGNLGMLAGRQDDITTAKACMDQHLQLIQGMNDYIGECNAWIQLGHFSQKEEKYEEALRYFEQARKLAKDTKQNGIMKQISCYIGISKGYLNMETLVKKMPMIK